MSGATVRLEAGAVVVTGIKAVYVLRPDELIGLLLRDPDLWCLAIARGKALRRGEAMAHRMENREQTRPAADGGKESP